MAAINWRETTAIGTSGFINVNDLVENEAFVSTTVQASYAAIRAHQAEKLAALRNAVLNSALPTAPNDSLQQIFIKWVDELTVEHLRFLELFRDPKGWLRETTSNHPAFPFQAA